MEREKTPEARIQREPLLPESNERRFASENAWAAPGRKRETGRGEGLPPARMGIEIHIEKKLIYLSINHLIVSDDH